MTNADTIKVNHCPACGSPIPADAPQGLCPKCVLRGAATAHEPSLSPTATTEIPTLERVAAAFPQLEILELIGRGGMGFVFKARQPHLDRFVALKLLPDKLARDPQFAERFNREGRVLARLNHPNIVSVYDFGRTADFYFLLMEFVDGVNLREAMHAGRFSPTEALSIVPKICEALQYAHHEGILHRDIKPANILLDTRGQVKLADFGIAKLVGSAKPDVTLTGTGAALGTPHYMAPEQLEKPAEVDHRADIYSLGVVFYEMLTGELPIGRFAPPSSKTPVGAKVDEVVFRTLERDRERRYQSAGEMKTQVEGLTGADIEGPDSPQKTALPVPKWSQKGIWAAVLTAISLPLPLLLTTLLLLRAGGAGVWEFALAAGSVCLPGLGGTILGWMSLSDIRAQRGQLRGLPFAIFGALVWPVLILLALTVLVPWLILGPPRTANFPRPFAASLQVLFLAAGTLTFTIWAADAIRRWALQLPARRLGMFKWVLLGLLVAATGALLASNSLPRPFSLPLTAFDPRSPGDGEGHALEVEPMIQITFTALGLNDEDDARWLTLDFIQQSRGQCERSFPWRSDVPGWTCEVRTTATLSNSDAAFPPVRHDRVSWKLPPALNSAAARAFRDEVAQRWIGQQLTVEPGAEETLFVLTLPDGGGTLTAGIAVTLLEEMP